MTRVFQLSWATVALASMSVQAQAQAQAQPTAQAQGQAQPTAQPAPPGGQAALPLAPPQQPLRRPHLALDATLDPAGHRITGTARWLIPNTSGQPLSEVRLWLYPNNLAVRPASLGDVNFHWLYPRGFSPSSIRIDDARVERAVVSVAVESSPAGADTVARIALPAAVPPGGHIELQVTFTTRVPERLGSFGCLDGACRLMGGFYPFPMALGWQGFDPSAPPDRIDYTARVTAPPATELFIGDGHARSSGSPVTASQTNEPYLALASDRALRVDEMTAAGLRARLFHHHVRPPSSAAEVLPYVREDREGLILEVVRGALEFVAQLGLDTGQLDTARPLTLIEAPLRHELVQIHGDVALVSDRLFGIFPAERLRKFHRLELIRAVLTLVVERALKKLEPDPDVGPATEVIVSYLTEVYTLREFRRLEFARDLLRPLSFIPAVDQLMYAPLLASSSSYFGDVGDDDRVRDDVRRFSHQRPTGRLLYAKLLDLLGSRGMGQLARTVLGERVPLRQAAARVFGADLGWFWRQWWTAVPPRVNYRLAGVRTDPLPPPGPGVKVTVDVDREGADLLEPVELRIIDKAGVAHDLTWTGRGARHRFEVDLPAGLAAVELDPRHRLVESAVGSLRAADDPLRDNRIPKRWRFIYSGFGALLDVTSLTASFAAAVTLKPRHDLRHSVLVLARRTLSTNIGVEAAYTRLFGRQADQNRLTDGVGASLAASLLNQSFGVASTETLRPQWRLSGTLFFDHDDRDYFIDPWRAIGVNAGIYYSVTGLESGERLSNWGGGVELLRLLELRPGHVLAANVQAGVTFGDILVRSQLGQIGGATGLRGYGPGELFGRGRAVARFELRNRYVSDLNWNLAHFTAVRALGGNLFFEAGAVTSCSDLSITRNDVFYDVGYSFRVLHDAFGVYQQLLSIDIAIPLNRHDRVCLGQHSLGPPNDPQMQISRPPFVVLISFLPSF